MRIVPIIGMLDNPVNTNDWYLLFMTVSLLFSLLLISPFKSYYEKGITAMFKFNSPEVDVVSAPYSQLGIVAVSFFSCVNLGLALVLSFEDVTQQEPSMIILLLSASGFFLLFFLFKMLLYQSINSLLYKRQNTTVKPIRWNGFFIMAFSSASLVILVLTTVVLFLGLPPVLLVIGGLLTLAIMEIGLIFCIKSALLKNKCSILGFILYLCALEILPIVLMLLVLSRIISST